MADPATLAIAGAGAGALLDKKDPLRGAALGGIGGYFGGPALFGEAGAAGATAAGMGPVTQGAAGQALAAGQAAPSMMSAFGPGASPLGSGLAGMDAATLTGVNAPLGSLPMGMDAAALNPLSQAATNAGIVASSAGMGLSPSNMQLMGMGGNMLLKGQQPQQQSGPMAFAPPAQLNPNAGGSFAQSSPFSSRMPQMSNMGAGSRRVGIL